MNFAHELTLLEPFGVGNRKPMFAVEVDNISPVPLKEGSPHLSFRTDYIDMIYFGGVQYEKLLSAPVKKTLIFEPNLSTFGGRESLKGYVKTFETEVVKNRELGLDLYIKNLRNLRKGGNSERAEYVSRQKINEIIEQSEKCPYGTLYVASTLKTIEEFPKLSSLPVYLNEPLSRNLANCVVLVLTGGNISGFKRIVYLDNPIFEVRKTKTAEVFVNDDILISTMMPSLNVSREAVGQVFSILRLNDGIKASSSLDLYLAGLAEDAQISRYQFVFAVEVLEELGIIKYENNKMRYNRNVKSDITTSKIYSKLCGRN
jgi:hypothetical protein